MSILAYPPLPVRDDWAPAFLRPRGTANRDFSFNVRDPQGPGGMHSAVDWFAPSGTPVRSPVDGVIVRDDRGTGTASGQVYGGVSGVEDAAGRVWVMRHVNPMVVRGSHVTRGQNVATVARWTDGAEHLHMEIWRDATGGYQRDNMIDPASVTWTEAVMSDGIAPYWMEELPFTDGGTGPVVRGPGDGYASPLVAAAVAARLRLGGARVSTVRAGGRTFILQWAEGTYGARYRWGPWADMADRDRVAAAREDNTGRVMRRFRGRGASLYPWAGDD